MILSEMESDMKAGRFVGGPRIERLEKALCEYTRFSHCVCVSTGTMAVEAAANHLNMHCRGKWGVPNLTFQATAFGALRGGLDIEILKDAGHRTAYLQEPRYAAPTIPVDLYGTPVNWEASTLYPLLVDGCQSLGAQVDGKHVGQTRVWAYAVSFYPGKNLGSMGEGGALLTNDADLARTARMYINQGQSSKGCHSEIGTNGRLHTLQAIPIYYGLRRLDSWNTGRRRVAKIYDEQIDEINAIHPICKRIQLPEGRCSTRHVYPIFSARAPSLREALKAAGIPFAQHYPERLSDSQCFTKMARVEQPKWAYNNFREEISLPIYPFLGEADALKVCDVLRAQAKTWSPK